MAKLGTKNSAWQTHRTRSLYKDCSVDTATRQCTHFAKTNVHLYVIREDNLEKCRGLGTLDLGIGLGGARGFTGFGDPFYVKKELIFKIDKKI